MSDNANNSTSSETVDLDVLDTQIDQLHGQLYYKNGKVRKGADHAMLTQYEMLCKQRDLIAIAASSGGFDDDEPLDVEDSEYPDDIDDDIDEVNTNLPAGAVDPVEAAINGNTQLPEVNTPAAVDLDIPAPAEQAGGNISAGGPVAEPNCPEIYKRVDPTAAPDPNRVDVRIVPKRATLQVNGHSREVIRY